MIFTATDREYRKAGENTAYACRENAVGSSRRLTGSDIGSSRRLTGKRYRQQPPADREAVSAIALKREDGYKICQESYIYVQRL